MTYIERYMLALYRYLEKECFCKPNCSAQMIVDAITAKGVTCHISAIYSSIICDYLVIIPNVKGFDITIDEEINAVHNDTEELIYCPAG